MKKKFFALCIVSIFILSMSTVFAKSSQINSTVQIKNENYETVIDGKPVHLYTLQNKNGMTAKITNYAGKLVQLLVPDKNGKMGDVVLGYDTLDAAQRGQVSMGCIIGRYANRIGKGQFTLDGTPYQLTINDGPNHLHGGTKGSRFVVFDANQLDDKTLQLNYYFKDGEEGYPGNCNLKVIYSLTDDNELKITYDATTDKPTIVNFTNHAFWNLAGEGNGTILKHKVIIDADYFTPIDNTLITTGEIRSVKGTPLDFTKAHEIGERINMSDQQLQYAKGYDFNWVLNKGNKLSTELTHAAKISEPTSGRVMDIYTTEPGLQMYSGNFLTGNAPKDIGKGNKAYVYRSALALETQHFPDSPNKNNFPTVTLIPGQWFTSTTIYKFSVEK